MTNNWLFFLDIICSFHKRVRGRPEAALQGPSPQWWILPPRLPHNFYTWIIQEMRLSEELKECLCSSLFPQHWVSFTSHTNTAAAPLSPEFQLFLMQAGIHILHLVKATMCSSLKHLSNYSNDINVCRKINWSTTHRGPHNVCLILHIVIKINSKMWNYSFKAHVSLFCTKPVEVSASRPHKDFSYTCLIFDVGDWWHHSRAPVVTEQGFRLMLLPDGQRLKHLCKLAEQIFMLVGLRRFYLVLRSVPSLKPDSESTCITLRPWNRSS